MSNDDLDDLVHNILSEIDENREQENVIVSIEMPQSSVDYMKSLCSVKVEKERKLPKYPTFDGIPLVIKEMTADYKIVTREVV